MYTALYYMRYYIKHTYTIYSIIYSDIVIPRLLKICPWAKVIIMLRDPVERAYSQYNMCIDTTGKSILIYVQVHV